MIYYWEGKKLHRHGSFEAVNNDEAMNKMPHDCVLLYHENYTEDGTPFDIVYEENDEDRQAQRPPGNYVA